jgi:hypothetical protein
MVEASHAGNDGFDGCPAEGMKSGRWVRFICSKGLDTIHKDVLPWAGAYAVRVQLEFGYKQQELSSLYQPHLIFPIQSRDKKRLE